MGDEPVTVWEVNAQWTERDPETVLVPLVDAELPQPALTAARALATGNEADLLIVNAVHFPEQTPFSPLERRRDDHRKTVQGVVESVREANPSLSVSGTVHLGRTRVATVADAVRDHDIGSVVVDETWCRSRLSPLVRSPVERLTGLVDCPVVAASGAALPATIESMLVATTGDSDRNGAGEIASRIARASDARIDRCHVRLSGPASTGRGQSGANKAEAVCVLEADDPAVALIERSREYDVTIRGAPQRRRLRRFVCGSTPIDANTAAESAVLTVWSGQSSNSTPPEEGWR